MNISISCKLGSLGLSGLNLTDGGGGLVGLGGLVRGAAAVEDYSEAKQLTQLFSAENNPLIHALLREILVLLHSCSHSPFYNMKKLLFPNKMYITFKIEGNGCRLSNIFSDGEFYKVPGHYNIILNKNALEYRDTDLNFDEAIEQIMEKCERDERNEEMDPGERSEEFKKTFRRIYIENFKRVFEYMKGYDDMSKKSRDEEYIGMIHLFNV